MLRRHDGLHYSTNGLPSCEIVDISVANRSEYCQHLQQRSLSHVWDKAGSRFILIDGLVDTAPIKGLVYCDLEA